MPNKYIKRYSTVLLTREMKIEIKMRYLYITARTDQNKQSQ